MPLTEYGKSILSSGGHNKSKTMKVVEKALSVGKSVSFTFNLSRLYDLSKAGDYSLHIERDIMLNEKNNSGKYRSVLSVKT